MRDLKRYSLTHEWNNDVMFESPEGPYVLYGEYDALREERDDWYNDASKHLLALCEKQGEVNGLEAQLAEVTVRRSETVAMYEHLRQRVVALENREQFLLECLSVKEEKLAAVTNDLERLKDRLWG